MRGVKAQFSFGLSLARRMDIRFDIPGPIWTPDAVPIPIQQQHTRIRIMPEKFGNAFASYGFRLSSTACLNTGILLIYLLFLLTN